MAFICKDCGNKSSKKFPLGKCPACNSYDIRNTNSTREAIREKEPKTLVEIVIMFLVWGLLAYGLWDKYLQIEPEKAQGQTVETLPAPGDDLGY